MGLEEHVVLPVLLDAWAKAGVPQIPQLGFGDAPVARRLRDVGEQRLADMDDQGVDVAVLSLATPGVQNLEPADAVSVAREANDALAQVVSTNPHRFQALAAIPTPPPSGCGYRCTPPPWPGSAVLRRRGEADRLRRRLGP